MRVTVCIATRNRPRFLRHALASVFAQTRRADEIVVIDDGTGQSAADVCRPFADVTYTCSEGRGIATARNIGVARATGDIVVVQDDDDVMFSGRIADHLAAFAEGVDATCGAWVNVTESARDAVLRFVPGHQTPNLTGLLLGKSCVAHGATAYRVNALREHPYNDALQVGSDMDLHARLFAGGASFRHTETVVLLRRLHEESVTQRHGADQRRLKEALRTRHLAGSHLGDANAISAQPRYDPADLDRALAGMAIDGARCVLGDLAKTLGEAVAIGARRRDHSSLVPLGRGGFVDVLVPITQPYKGDVMPGAGVAAKSSAGPSALPGDETADPVASLGLLEGGGRILIDIDGLDISVLAALDQRLSLVSPSWRFVAAHPVLALAYAMPPELVIASNRFATGESLARAFTCVADALRASDMPLRRLAVGAVQRGSLIGLKV